MDHLHIRVSDLRNLYREIDRRDGFITALQYDAEMSSIDPDFWSRKPKQRRQALAREFGEE
jgi:hypothetical protein